jgi:hypothetical protein
MFQLRRQSGVLRARHGAKSMTLVLHNGYLEFATSVGTDDEFRFGRYLIEKGWIKRDVLDEIVQHQPADKLLGELLIDKEIIDEEQLVVALAKQCSELVYELLRWPDGRFVLTDEPSPAAADKAQLGLGLSELVLEGFRRVDEWRLMADTIDFNAVVVVDQVALGTVDDAKIATNERPVLDAIDGERPVREVMEATDLASFDAISALYRLLQSRIVREKSTKEAQQARRRTTANKRPSEPTVVAVSAKRADGDPAGSPANKSNPGNDDGAAGAEPPAERDQPPTHPAAKAGSGDSAPGPTESASSNGAAEQEAVGRGSDRNTGEASQ